MPIRISREDLYREIWAEPATKLARRYDVSSSYLARVCEALNVPHPPRGYWARRTVGVKIPIPPLPPAGPGDPLSWEKGVAVLERLPTLEPQPSVTSKTKIGQRRRLSQHPLVTAWRSHLEDASPTESGYLLPRKKNVLDAFVTTTMVRAAADALNSVLLELESRGAPVRLSADYSHRRPAVDVTQAPIRDQYSRRPNDWLPGRPTLVYVAGAVIGLTLFELTEHVRVRRKGADRYVRISDLPALRRYAPQSPDEADLTRDMPTGRFVLRAYSPIYDTNWQHEWTERQAGEFAGMAKEIADVLVSAATVLVKQVQDAEHRARERRAQLEEESRRHRAREAAEALARARHKAKEDLRSIVGAWNDAFALEAFFAELSRRAETLEGHERANLETRIRDARQLMGARDAIDRFLSWKVPTDSAAVLPDDELADYELDEGDT